MILSTPEPDLESKEALENELWVVQYGSSTYNKINWWSEFMLSKYVDQKALREGNPYLLGTQTHLPNRWTLVYSLGDDSKQALQNIKECWERLGKPRLRFYGQDPDLMQLTETLFHGEIAPKRLFLQVEI